MIKRLLLGVIAVGLVAVGGGAGKVHAASGVDMRIRVSAPKTATVYDTVNHVVTVTNLGDKIAHHVVVKNNFTAPVFPAAWPTNCQWHVEQYNVNTVVCNMGDVKPGKTVSYSYSYTTPFADQQVRTRHVVYANQADTNTSNNSVATLTTIKQ